VVEQARRTKNIMAEKQIGKITHYFDKIGVGVIELTDGSLTKGDKIRIQGHDSDFEQVVMSMQIDREEVNEATAGQTVGFKADQPVRGHDIVYKIEE